VGVFREVERDPEQEQPLRSGPELVETPRRGCESALDFVIDVRPRDARLAKNGRQEWGVLVDHAPEPSIGGAGPRLSGGARASVLARASNAVLQNWLKKVQTFWYSQLVRWPESVGSGVCGPTNEQNSTG